MLGDAAEDHYRRVDADGVVHVLVPEFARMSVRPGIGARWFQRFGSDVAVGDSVVHDGAQYPVPAYYDRLRKRVDPLGLAEVKAGREFRAYGLRADATDARLAVREGVAAARLSLNSRSFES